MSLLRLEGVVREIGTFVILDGITASIAPGERVGLVGPNGAGKTTLLRIAAGQDEPDRGIAARKRGLSLGLLGQESHFDEAFMAAPDLRSAVRHGAAHLERMAEELARLEHDGHAAGTDYADLQHRFDILGGYTLDQRVDEALSGLGFARDEWARPTTAISGGQQTRAALARLVIADPDLLLLDEPTNHLDIGAIEWLEEHLRRRAGALLVASHDRAFLDATVSRVWELRDRRLTVFRGDYTAYHRQRVERDARAEREAESHDDAIAREVELVQRYRSQRKHVKMHEHEARLEKLREQRVETPKAGKALKLPGNALAGGPVRSGELAIRLDDLAVGYLPGRGALRPDGSDASEPVTRRADPVPRRPQGRADRHRRAERRGQDDAVADDRGRPAGARRGDHLRPQRAARLPRPAARRRHPRRDRPRRHPRGDPGDARRGPRVPRPVPVPRRRRVQGGPPAVGRRAVAPRARPAGHPPVQPAPARRADEPPRHRRARGHRGVPGRGARRRSSSCRTTGGCSRRSASACGWSTTGSRCRSTTATARGGRRWGRAGPSRPRRPRRANRGKAPAAGRSTSRAPAAVGDRAQRRRRRAPSRSRRPAPKVRQKLSKEAYRRRREALDGELSRLGLRRSQLELAVGTPAVAANFVEMRRVTSELADVERALAEAEDAWLELEEQAP